MYKYTHVHVYMYVYVFVNKYTQIYTYNATVMPESLY